MNAVCGTHSFLPLSAPGSVPEKSLLSSYHSLKFHIHSVGDVCGSYAREHPKGRPVSGACRGEQLSPVTETWVSSIRARPSFSTPLSFSPVSYNTHGSRRPFTDPYRGHGIRGLGSGCPGARHESQIFSQQPHKAVSPNCACLPDGISFSSLLLPLPAHLCGRKDRLMGIVLIWCHHAGIRSRTLCVTGKLSATEPRPWPGN